MNAPLQRRPAQAVEMSLMPEILISSEFKVDALRLKNHTDLPPQARRFLRRIRQPMIIARPALGIINVERIRNSVVFPLPFGPSSPNNSAGRTSNETPFRAVRFS